MKKAISKILRRPVFARRIVKTALKLHNYSYRLAGRFSQATAPDKAHPKHRLMDYHGWFTAQLKPEWSVLEIGCGGGFLASDLQKSCKELTVIDIVPKNAQDAAERLSQVEVLCGDATTYDFGRTFDAIVLSNVLEHIEERVVFLCGIADLAETFLVRVPLIDRDWITLYKQELGIEHRLDPTHFTEYTEAQFVAELNEAQLHILSSRIRYGELYAIVKKRT
jgi:2-polyprenyl-3-methyl-5-hydroxy-6-metoxy-1,4-benzoquinol methylase